MNEIIKFNQREIIEKMEVIEKLLNDDLRKGLFETEKLLYQSEIKSDVVDLFIKHWKDNYGDTITLYRGTKYGSRTKNVGAGFFGLEESEMEFTFNSKPVGSKKNYYKPLIGFRFRKIDNIEMKENKMIKSFKLFEYLTSKTEVQEEIDRLIDKGFDNLTPEELDFLKNPVIKKKERPIETETNEIDKYYRIAEDFFKRVVGRDIRNFELNDKLSLFDIFDSEDEVYHVANTIYYMYGVQIDPENDDDYVLLNIFKKIYHRIQK